MHAMRWPGVVAGGLALACACGVAGATNGMLAPGNGTTQLGLAGAGTALAEDAAATLRNPAAGAWLGSGQTFDLGMAIPKGGYRAGPVGEGSRLGMLELASGYESSASGVHPVPGFARNWRIDERSALGIGFTASGLKTLSRAESAHLGRGVPGFDVQCRGTLGGGGPVAGSRDPRGLCGNVGEGLGADLMQLFLSAHWSYRPRPEWSLGLAPVIELQRLQVRGIGAFTDFSNEPSRVTDNGPDMAYGAGLRAGLLWEMTPGIGLGFAYQSRVYNTEFDRYRGVIIGGAIDQPPIYDLGLQIHLAPRQRLLLDIQHIRYAHITPLGRGVDAQYFTDECFIPRLLGGREGPLDACAGGVQGPGFGWDNMTIYKLGYQGSRGRLTWRAGFSYGRQPVGEGQILSAVFAPAITERHAALGLSWALRPRVSVDWALVHALKNRKRELNAMSNAQLQLLGANLIGFRVDADPQDQVLEAELEMWQSQFGVTWRFE